jgi:hypothetical protein
MTKRERGTKRRSNSCNTKFFDLNADPIVCSKCLLCSHHRSLIPCRRGAYRADKLAPRRG